ncbi:MAG TPA: substrate-binding domain-containing protein [Candidatus Hydrogenedentes bacterium]|nr:substrate-binding domain-containing protein [Candidatus Hydrogenedentota bacterium]
MQKYEHIAKIIHTRVKKGDYALRSVPAERQLASEVGVSYMTVRRAVQELVAKGILVRLSNGRLGVGRASDGTGPRLQLGLLAPTFNSPVVEQWRIAIESAAETYKSVVRPVLYMHWDDPILQDSLEGFDGVFLVPIPDAIPPRVTERLMSAKRLVMVDHDMSHLGIPSIQLFPPVFVQRLLDHLAALGHQRIDCLNVHSLHPVIEQRIKQWQIWCRVHGYEGQLFQGQTKPHEAPYAVAYRTFKRLLDEKRFHATALLCVTAPAAIGAMRALHEQGIQPGRDVSVCAVNSESMGETLIPSLTALEAPDPTPYVAECVDWMADSQKNWVGPLLVQPAEIPLVARESTGKVPTSPTR